MKRGLPTGPTAIVHLKADGAVAWHATPGVVLLIVDENAPADRVYEMRSRLDAAGIAAIVGDSEIATADDPPAVRPASHH